MSRNSDNGLIAGAPQERGAYRTSHTESVRCPCCVECGVRYGSRFVYRAGCCALISRVSTAGNQRRWQRWPRGLSTPTQQEHADIGHHGGRCRQKHACAYPVRFALVPGWYFAPPTGRVPSPLSQAWGVWRGCLVRNNKRPVANRYHLELPRGGAVRNGERTGPLELRVSACDVSKEEKKRPKMLHGAFQSPFLPNRGERSPET